MSEEQEQAIIDRYRLLFGDKIDKVIGEVQREICGGTSADMLFCFRRHIAEIGFLIDATIAKAVIVETGEPPAPAAALN